MASGVNIRAILSALPVVGPVVGAYNVVTSKLAISSSRFMLLVSEAAASHAYANDNDKSYSQAAENFETHRQELIETLKREVVYSKAALVGHLVNLIGIIVLIAVGVFTAGPLAGAVTAALAVGSIYYAYNAYLATEKLKGQGIGPMRFMDNP